MREKNCCLKLVKSCGGRKKKGWGWGEMAFGGTDLQIRAQQRDILIRRFERKRNGLDSRRTSQTFLKITPGFQTINRDDAPSVQRKEVHVFTAG